MANYKMGAGIAGLERLSRAQITVCPVKVISFKYRRFEMVTTHQMCLINILYCILCMSTYTNSTRSEKDKIMILSFSNSNHDG